MKVNREYVILAILIVALTGYLVFRQTNRIHYTLPVISKVDSGRITGIDIIRPEGKTVLVKKDGAWYIEPHSWRADNDKATEMVKDLSDLVVTDLASEARAYDRYQLDDKSRVRVKAYAGKDLVRELDVGKTASTYHHTYIMLPGNPDVYLASGDLSRLFHTPEAELRDMLVFSVSPPDITSIEIDRSGVTTTLTKEKLVPEGDKKEPAEKMPPLFLWKDEKGAVVDKAKIDVFLSSLSKVYCDKYLDDSMKPSLTRPVLSLRLKGAGVHTLSIFEKTGQTIPAISSEAESPFAFPGYKDDALMKSVNEIAPEKTSNDKK